jgi:hypothetical protein
MWIWFHPDFFQGKSAIWGFTPHWVLGNVREPGRHACDSRDKVGVNMAKWERLVDWRISWELYHYIPLSLLGSDDTPGD